MKATADNKTTTAMIELSIAMSDRRRQVSK
jgi:hypothetical protein